MDVFCGEYNVILDEKGRIALPSKIRPRNEDGSAMQLTLVPGMEGCLALYTPTGWAEFQAGVAELSYDSRDLRFYKRFFYPSMAQVTPDKQGRFLITEKLIALAGLNEKVLVLGVDSLIEIWDPDTYFKSINDRDESGTIEDIAERLAEMRSNKRSGNGMGNGSRAEE